MNSPQPPSKMYLRLLDQLHQDISDDVDQEGIRPLERNDVMARADLRAGKIKFALAKLQLQKAPKPSMQTLGANVIAHAREIFDAIVRREPALTEKYSLAFRSGKELPEEEVLQILGELRALGVDLDDIAVRLAK